MNLPRNWDSLLSLAIDVTLKIFRRGIEFAKATRSGQDCINSTTWINLCTELGVLHEQLTCDKWRFEDEERSGKLRKFLEELDKPTSLMDETVVHPLSVLRVCQTEPNDWSSVLHEILAAFSHEALIKLTDMIHDYFNRQYDTAHEDPAISYDATEYSADVNLWLATALIKHLVCQCTKSSSGETRQHPHSTNILLEPFSRKPKNGDIEFEVLIRSSVPLSASAVTVSWRDTVLLVKKNCVIDRAADTSRPFEDGEFCQLIRKNARERLTVRIEKEEVRRKRPREPKRTLLCDEGVSLSCILTDLTVEMKMVLSYILARSIWEFYDSDVVNTELTAETIHFMWDPIPEDPSSQGVFIQRPFLFLKDGCPTLALPEYRYNDFDHLNLYSRVEALGIMMVEIGTGSVLQHDGSNDNSRYITAYELSKAQLNVCREPSLKRKRNRQEMPPQPFWRVVESCLDRNFFESEQEDLVKVSVPEPEKRLARRKRVIFDKIVQPLEKILHRTEYLAGIGGIESVLRRPSSTMNHGGGDSSEVALPASERRQTHLHLHTDNDVCVDRNVLSIQGEALRTEKRKKNNHTRFSAQFFDDCHGTDGGSPRKSKEWIRRLRGTHDLLVPDSIDDCHRVRIAILDTGADLEHPNLLARSERIRETRAWVNRNNGETHNGVNDVDGHGTHITDLLLDVAPKADVLIMKVADTGDDLAYPLQIAEAINHAIEKNVDIISMSFGYSTNEVNGYIELRKAIEAADHKGITMFAAASNDGGNSPRAFPAHEPEVVCIHSTDSYGNSSAYNPDRMQDRDNFSTLGDHVDAAWPIHLSNDDTITKTKSGTSFATPIAAGIGAILLQYARQQFPDLIAVKRSKGLKAMLREISRVRGDYNYLFLDSSHPRSFFASEMPFREHLHRALIDA